jgi:hypothetical protein
LHSLTLQEVVVEQLMVLQLLETFWVFVVAQLQVMVVFLDLFQRILEQHLLAVVEVVVVLRLAIKVEQQVVQVL